ncbi:helix-turn-helix domain-containing protein [Streptomyces sp. NBC_00620]|uniref:helix-turn-helix domain-containing protein n=1 Tax=Streptomyces sp. NBC_00620 TaxID=2903666 RepID=UPI002252161C|nr:helix-turn-helix domain-containing protein [Streptomyces sp. NBC_00620]MCX4974263.1 helix-turn-helix domain-containing protein [Streptomyces sp. NBC_00620]
MNNYTSREDVQRVAERLREGATYEEIRQEVGVSRTTIGRIRRRLDIPKTKRTRPCRTVAESLALYVEPYGDGHARWTGTMAGAMPVVWGDGRNHNARHVAFRARYGREPIGYVLTSCDEAGCLAGDHVTDDLIRERTADTYEAIFGNSRAGSGS